MVPYVFSPTWLCVDMFNVLEHLRNSHRLLSVWIQLPIHEQSCFPNSSLKACLCTQLLHLLKILQSDA